MRQQLSIKLPKINNRHKSNNRTRTQENSTSSKQPSNKFYLSLMRQKLVHPPDNVSKYLQRKSSQKKLDNSRISHDLTIIKQQYRTINPQTVQEKRYLKKISQIIKRIGEHEQSLKNSRVQSSQFKQSRIHAYLLKNQAVNHRIPIKEQRYEKIITSYDQYAQNIKKINHSFAQINQIFVNISQWQHLTLGFINQLRTINRFFLRLPDIVAIALLKAGKIKTIQEKQYLYYQNDPATTFYIILWGQFKLKTQFSNIVKYCVAGDSLGEQIIFEQSKVKKSQSSLFLLNHKRPRLQSAKATIKSGVLQIKLTKFQWLKKQLSALGEKDKFYLAEKMIGWGLTKKAKFHKN